MKIRSGFTIVELLAAITIILVLAGLIVSGARKAREMAKIEKAKADIAAFETAIMQFKADTGQFPPMGPWLCNRFKSRLELGYYIGPGGTPSGEPFINDTTGDPRKGTPITGWQGPYMHFKQEDLFPSDNDCVVDPWGTIYMYAMPSDPTKSGSQDYFDLHSAGPDTDSDTTRPATLLDDIINW